ncbi:hypothetical protein ACXJJ3_02235 [Kribbella sp. WER1]
MFDYDAELQRYQPRLRAACAVRPGDRVLRYDVRSGYQPPRRDVLRGSGGVLFDSDAWVARAE